VAKQTGGAAFFVVHVNQDRQSPASVATTAAPVAKAPAAKQAAVKPAAPKEAAVGKSAAAAPAQKEKKPKKEKAEAPPKAAVADQSVISKMDFRVGRIVEVSCVSGSDKLYQEKIDLGEETGPRTILSGLQQFVPIEQMQNKMVCVVANLKPRPMGPDKIKSAGMVLCASSADHSAVALLSPPEGSKIGERIQFDGCEGEPFTDAQVQKKKVLEEVMPDLHTNADGVAQWKDKSFTTSAGVCACKTMPNANVG
jgi:methionine--tRNA ligase beta chain